MLYKVSEIGAGLLEPKTFWPFHAIDLFFYWFQEDMNCFALSLLAAVSLEKTLAPAGICYFWNHIWWRGIKSARWHPLKKNSCWGAMDVSWAVCKVASLDCTPVPLVLWKNIGLFCWRQGHHHRIAQEARVPCCELHAHADRGFTSGAQPYPKNISCSSGLIGSVNVKILFVWDPNTKHFLKAASRRREVCARMLLPLHALPSWRRASWRLCDTEELNIQHDTVGHTMFDILMFWNRKLRNRPGMSGDMFLGLLVIWSVSPRHLMEWKQTYVFPQRNHRYYWYLVLWVGSLFSVFLTSPRIFSVLFLVRNALVVLCPLLPSPSAKAGNRWRRWMVGWILQWLGTRKQIHDFPISYVVICVFSCADWQECNC